MSDAEAGKQGLTHLDAQGRARMVDVGEKPEGERRARAEASVRMAPETAAAVEAADGPKGDVIGPARLAGIAAAKRTGELIPLGAPAADHLRGPRAGGAGRRRARRHHLGGPGASGAPASRWRR